jgi:hypothetical protein
MAVKVISVKPAKSVVKKVVCRNCGAKLEYVPKDVKEYHGTDYGGGPDGREWIVCPNCREDVTLRSW